MTSKSNYRLNVNGKYEFEIDSQKLEGQDIIPIGKNKFHAIVDNESIKSTILTSDIPNKIITVDVDGVEYEVSIEDSFDQLVNQMGLSANVVKKLSEIKAPMPGLVLDIMVNEGDELEEGDNIMILEAMKMENVIKAPNALTIKKILIKKGEAVDKNQILIDLDS